MTIRFAELADTKQIIELCREHAIYEDSSFDSENKEDALSRYLFNSTGIVKCLVVEYRGELIGYATFMKQFSTWDAGYYIYLDCLYLKESTRGKGLGNKLMSQVMEYAKSEECATIQWQTPSFNKNAITFYERLGARSKSKERFFWQV